MNKTDIMIAFYETIKESMEWASMFEGKEYGSFVDGVVAVTERMLERYDERPIPYNLAPFAKVEEYGKEDIEL